MMLPEPFRRSLIAWFEAHGRDLPWRQTRDPYAILVSEMMLQQTQVATVIDYFHRWMRRFPAVGDLARAELSDVLHAWQGLGYYARARNLHETARRLEGREFPASSAAMAGLPGIGSYTAAAVATFAFDESVPVLEANTIRVLARLFNYTSPVDTSAGRAFLGERATELLPAANAGPFNTALMELGALVCIPRRPRCGACPVNAFCAAREPETLPVKRPRRTTLLVTQACGFAGRGQEILLEQQTGSRWRGLWCLPPLHAPAQAVTPLVTLKYAITHHSVTLSVFRQPPPEELLVNQRWVEREALAGFPMPTPQRKALARLLELPDS